MFKLVLTSKFNKDLKKIKKRGYDLSKIEKVIDALLNGERLSYSKRDHALTGNYHGFRECHIEPDWLLIYAIDEDRLILTASRTGTHSDLYQG